MNRRPKGLLLAGLALALVAIGGAGGLWLHDFAVACPFCGGVQQTLSDEINTAEASVIAKLVGKVEKAAAPKPTEKGIPVPPEVLKTRFEIVETLKGSELVGDAKEVEVLYFGEAQPGTPFLIHATELDGLAWGTPVVLTDRAVSYVRQLADLPTSGGERLAFFRKYLEDADELMARDSFDEFAKAPYADVKAVTDYLDHDQLLGWINNAETLTSHKRLYLLMLGLVSRSNPLPEDLKMLEEGINADPKELKPALDAMIGCYLTLKGADGLPMIEDKFLKDKECPYSDTYSAIMALRFHGQEESIIPREKVLAALRHLLDRPELADLIIPDLARWEDWSAMDRLVTLFKDADDKSSWVRVPVIQYLKACPLPAAEEELKELAKIDPDSVRRANFFVPLGGTAPKPIPPAAQSDKGENGEPAASAEGAAEPPNSQSTPAGEQTAPAAEKPEKSATKEPSKAGARRKDRADRRARASAGGADQSSAANVPPAPRGLMAAPFAGGAALLGLMLTIMRPGQTTANE